MWLWPIDSPLVHCTLNLLCLTHVLFRPSPFTFLYPTFYHFYLSQDSISSLHALGKISLDKPEVMASTISKNHKKGSFLRQPSHPRSSISRTKSWQGLTLSEEIKSIPKITSKFCCLLLCEASTVLVDQRLQPEDMPPKTFSIPRDLFFFFASAPRDLSFNSSPIHTPSQHTKTFSPW